MYVCVCVCVLLTSLLADWCTLQPSKRIFLGNLPLLVSASDIKQALVAAQGGGGGAPPSDLEWICDKATGAFYGSGKYSQTPSIQFGLKCM